MTIKIFLNTNINLNTKPQQVELLGRDAGVHPYEKNTEDDGCPVEDCLGEQGD